MPRRRYKQKDGRLETSVCRSTFLTNAQIWRICAKYFDGTTSRPAIGRGMGKASTVIAVGLEFDADGTPYAEHANIIGWRDGGGTPDEELKHFWMDQAQKMAPKFMYEPRV